MKNFSIKKLLFSAVLFLLSFTFAREFSITKHPDSMFWTIDSTDRFGNPSRIYVLGTIHLADESIHPVPDYILDAWDEADRIYGELSSSDWKKVYSKTLKLLSKAVIKDKDKWVENFLTEDELETLKELLGPAVYEGYKRFEPWVFTNSLSSLVYKNAPLSAEYSYDIYFINKGDEEDTVISGLDKIETQLDLLHFGTFEEQIAMLKESLKQMENPDEEVDGLTKMYELYKSGDEDAFSEFYDQLKKDAAEHNEVYERYYTTMLDERNKSWGITFGDLLDKGGTTFVFAGTGHFLGSKSTFTLISFPEDR